MSFSLSPMERETVMQVDDETMEWVVWTCQPKMMTKFRNAGWEQLNVYREGNRVLSCEYRLPFNAITIRSKRVVTSKREISPEHLAKLQAGKKNAKSKINSTP